MMPWWIFPAVLIFCSLGGFFYIEDQWGQRKTDLETLGQTLVGLQKKGALALRSKEIHKNFETLEQAGFLGPQDHQRAKEVFEMLLRERDAELITLIFEAPSVKALGTDLQVMATPFMLEVTAPLEMDIFPPLPFPGVLQWDTLEKRDVVEGLRGQPQKTGTYFQVRGQWYSLIQGHEGKKS